MSRASLGASAPRPLRVDTQGIVCSPFIEDKIFKLVLDVGFLSHVPSSGDAVDLDLYLEPMTTFLSEAITQTALESNTQGDRDYRFIGGIFL
jgi:hypothetical protein